MKHFTLVIATILAMFLITSCSETTSSDNTENIEEKYYNTAMEYVNNGDVDTAVAVLEEGISVTKSEKLAKVLEEIKSDKSAPEQPDATEQPEVSEETDIPQEPEKADYSKYVGTWLSDESKLILSMTDENTLYVNSNSFSRSFEEYINISNIVENKYSTECYDMMLDCNMKVEILFQENVIVWNELFLTGDTSSDDIGNTEYFEKYVPSNATLNLKDYFANNYSANLYSSNDSIELYVESEILSLDLKLDNDKINISYEKMLGTFNGTDIKLTPDQEGGNSISFKIQSTYDGYYEANPFGTDGTVTLTFDGNNISYKLTDCSFATDKTEDILSPTSFSWADMSGLYYDENEGYRLGIYIGYDENTNTYSATFDGSDIDYLSVEGYTLSGMILNSEITLTYDPNTELVAYSSFDYTSRQSYNTSLYRIAS